MSADKNLDLKGLNCPMPVLKTKKALEGLNPGETILVEITDKGSTSDIPAMLKRTGNELVNLEEKGEVFHFLIKKGGK